MTIPTTLVLSSCSQNFASLFAAGDWGGDEDFVSDGAISDGIYSGVEVISVFAVVGPIKDIEDCDLYNWEDPDRDYR